MSGVAPSSPVTRKSAPFWIRNQGRRLDSSSSPSARASAGLPWRSRAFGFEAFGLFLIPAGATGGEYPKDRCDGNEKLERRKREQGEADLPLQPRRLVPQFAGAGRPVVLGWLRQVGLHPTP